MGSTNALQINSLITALVAKIITLRIWRYICSNNQASFWLRNLLDFSLTSATNWGWTWETNVNRSNINTITWWTVRQMKHLLAMTNKNLKHAFTHNTVCKWSWNIHILPFICLWFIRTVTFVWILSEGN